MKYVRVVNSTVREIIPDTATTPSIAHWYGASFAAQCVEADDDVQQGWDYDASSGTFSAPVITEEEPETNADDVMLDLLADHEYRLCMIELGGE